MRKPLEGVVVLDLTRVLAGPYCSMLLADLGAEVIKVEMPGKGDDNRAFGPFKNGKSVYYAGMNRGKKGVTLNLKSEEGKETFKKLVKKADIVLENYRPGVMDKLGLSYDVLKEVNPAIIYGCVSGFGHNGPLSQKAGYDPIAQAYGGLMSVTGWESTGPTVVGVSIIDITAGMNLAIGILACLQGQRETGIGDKVDVSLVDTVVSILTNLNNKYIVDGILPARKGNRNDVAYPADSFETSDGYVMVAAANNKLFKLITEAIDQPELANDHRFDTPDKRVTNHKELKEIIDSWTKTMSTNEVVEKLDKAGIPVSPINDLADVFEDDHLNNYRNMFPKQEVPGIGEIVLINNAIKLTQSSADPIEPAPIELGRDNEKIYKDFIGLTDEEYQSLIDNDVI